MDKKDTQKKRLVLLDSHAIIHRAYHALPDFSSSKGQPTGALYGLSTMLIKIIGELKPDYIVACYDLPEPTYRHEAYEAYKAGRQKTDSELVSQLEKSRELFQAFNIPMYDKAGFEADDMLGTIVHTLKDQENISIIIASGDMDTLQLVDDKKVQVYTLKKGINDTILYDEDAVLKRFGFGPKLLPDYKGLRGDPSDNIVGIAGIGEKTATTLITNFGSIEDMYKALKKDKTQFEKAGIKPRIIKLLEEGKEEAEFSKMLGTIRHDAPIGFSLPEKTWREGVDIKKVASFFDEMEFRTLRARVESVLLGEKKDAAGLGSDLAREEGAKSTVQEEIIDTREEKEMKIMVSLINSTMTQPDREDIKTVAKTDSLSEAKKVLLKEIEKRNLGKVFEEIEKPLIPIIEKMDLRGVKIDTAYLKKLSLEYTKILKALEKKIWKEAGEEFNISSPKQLSEILFTRMGLVVKNHKKTGGGALSTKESELEKMRELHPIISLILEYRELAKLLGTYIDTIPTLVDKKSRLHTTFLQIGAATGRMASKNPGLQNIPNKTDLGRKIRNAFIAESGFELVAFDYSQIELRIAAFLSNDAKLIEVFKKGEDVHTVVASEVFGVDQKDVTKDMRRQAKVINFGVMYGMGINALRANLGTTRVEAQKFYEEYFKKFSGLATYLDHIKADAARKGYTETFFGRRRYFEGITSKIPYIRASAERMAINAPIQGTEADIIKLAMVRIDDYILKNNLTDKVYLLLQVHDELVYEMATDVVGAVSPKIKDIMETVISKKETKGIVCVADISVGKTWGGMEKFKA